SCRLEARKSSIPGAFSVGFTKAGSSCSEDSATNEGTSISIPFCFKMPAMELLSSPRSDCNTILIASRLRVILLLTDGLRFSADDDESGLIIKYLYKTGGL